MNRYNIFYHVHKGLRAMLYDAGNRLQQTDFSNTDEITALCDRLSNVLNLFDKHAATEDQFILPAISQYEPAVSTLFAEEHVQNHTLGEKLRSVIKGLQQSSNEYDHQTWGAVLRPLWVEFIVFNLQHMAKEEDVLNPLLWRYYSDEELQQITQQIIAYQPADMMQQYSTWMLRSLSNDEIIRWLQQVRATAPIMLYQGLLDLARRELSTERFNIVDDAISENWLVA